MAAAADALPIEQVASRWIVATTPDEVVDAVRPYVEAGFDHLVFHGPGHDQEQFLTSFADEVLPGVRGLGG
jgi:coenzyme F420-dependent glucose-6-phosphate dehydrogenase